MLFVKKSVIPKAPKPFDPGVKYNTSHYIVAGVNVFDVGEAVQDAVVARLRFIDIGFILNGSSFGSSNVSYLSEELSLVSTNFRIFLSLFFQELYFLFY